MIGENNWFNTDKGRWLMAKSLASCAPWVSPLCGHNALVLQSCMPEVSLPVLQCMPVYQLHRANRRLCGDVLAEDARLPLVNECMALVLAAFMLESTADPAALIAECERVLVPEGHLALLLLNPLAPMRLSGVWHGLRLLPASAWQAMLREAGLDLVRHHRLGRSRPEALRSVNFLLLRKRKAALIPRRKNAMAAALAREQTPL